MADRTLEKDIQKAIKTLRKLPIKFSEKESKKILRKAAKPAVEAAKNNINKTAKPHTRYRNGQVVAKYYPGNLRRSIKVLPLRRTRRSVFIGPRLKRGGDSTGDFKGNRVDGYYAHFVEYGTPTQRPQFFMRRAYNSTRSKIAQTITAESERVVKQYKKQHRVI